MHIRTPSNRAGRILATALMCLLLATLLPGCGGGGDFDADCAELLDDTTTGRVPTPPAMCTDNPAACA